MKTSKLAWLALPALILSQNPAFAATTKAAKPKPPVLKCKTAAADGLTYTVIKPGKGERPGADARVTVNYKGYLKADGSEFDAGQDAKFPVGGVIPGFAQGLQLMQPGGKYRLCIPAALGYGEAGSGADIPPNADLVFEVDLISFKNPTPKPVIPVDQRSCPQKTETGFGYAVIRQGTGSSPSDADMMLIDLTTFDAATGIVQEKGQWEKITMREATPLFREAIKMMKMGSSYRFCLPENTDAEGVKDPQVNIIVDLLDIRPAPVVED
jgi:FKBP-type peptidyl-prolyl cis-trans isomerase